MARRTDPKVVKKALALHEQGMSTREIGEELKIHHSTVANFVRKYGKKVKRPAGGELPAIPTTEIEDRIELDGKVNVTRPGKLLSPERLAELAEVDLDVWVPKNMKSNIWHGFYKKKPITPEQVLQIMDLVAAKTEPEEIVRQLNAGEGHVIVPQTQSSVTFQRIMAEDVQDAILSYVAKHVKPFDVSDLPETKPGPGEEVAIAWGLWDTHFGMYAWQSEVGYDYDVNITSRRVLNSVDDMVRNLQGYNVRELWMPIGNDFLHYDNVKRTTAMGDNLLDTDTRFGLVFEAGLEALAYMVQRALEICDNLYLPYIPGNHDRATSYCIASALNQRFRNDPRVTVDLGANPRKYVTFGGTLVMFDHGQIPPAKYPIILAEEAREHISTATYKEVQIGHTHQRAAKDYQSHIPTNGVRVCTNPTLCSADYWHHQKGFIGEAMKSVEAFVYNRIGRIATHTAWGRDDERKSDE